MESNNVEFTLPPAPRGLCFDRNDFVKTNFSVDNFLADHQNVASLETMRDDLGVYLKVLRLAMIELINKDYANFVNLCATLIGFDKAIVKVQVPLGQLNEEVLSVKQCLEEAMKELSMWLSQRHALQKKKQLLKYYSQALNCLKTLDNILKNISDKKKHEQIILADRAVMQYNQLKFSTSKCENLLKNEHKILYNEVGGKIVQALNELLFQFWNDNDEENLLKTFITLASLDRVTETEMLIRKQAVAPLLQDIINESSLQRSREGLQGIYSRVLELLDTKLKLLLAVTQHSKLTFLVKKFRFLVNCFWCEVESRLEVNLASIFAPGNPQVFYQRYNESIQFIRRLEERCGTQEMVKFMRDTAEYKSFQRRWNLPVYFQIRFQEIAGNYEATLQNSPTTVNTDGFLLKETHSCWKAVEDCWADGVYIEALAHKFWKLSLQLLSRYATWAEKYCTQKSSSPKLETASLNKALIENCFIIYVDTQTLLQRLPQFLQIAESKITVDNKDLLRQSLKPSENVLKGTKDKIKECIVTELFEYFNVQLKQVSDIPRLYRKTNRSVPSKPCVYIDVVSRAIDEFNNGATKRLDNAFLVEVYEALFNTMTVSYYKYVEDVLTSVQKTEESLRRLKQIREKTSQQNADSAGVTDGDKIRLQLNVDVLSYAKMAEALHLNVHSVHKYTELYSMVTEAVKNIDIK
ncbi:conserved oligomeric Golgi complex subunit 2 [Ostrinia furnacalis]|uniref:conserved oligomeric Golgi complex subunit 2 n=1 Tax=Ostrinia furnacalis TaxID=93504 RepID=UPI00103F387C|nr:conserved oligomeric Golgi complex subunit 2 [Ostrinia furnacalis]